MKRTTMAVPALKPSIHLPLQAFAEGFIHKPVQPLKYKKLSEHSTAYETF